MRIALASAAFLAALAPAIAGVSMNPQTAPKGSYAIDPNHTSVSFCIQHMGLSNYCGRFGGATGKIVFNGSQPDRSSASIDIAVAGIDTPSAKLNEELKRGFFETDKFPKASFVSKKITLTGKTTADIAGDLTLHGVTKPVTLHTTFNGGMQHPMANAYAVGFSATARINVSDYSFPDVDWKIFVGNEVTLSIEAEFTAEK
jgi:polyisoprenoid-binding protein YceI